MTSTQSNAAPSERMARSYLCIFAAITAVGLAVVSVLNLLVDPSGAYPAVSLSALGSYRQQSVTRPAKAEMLLRTPCEILLLGSSRVQVGLPVRASAYGTNRVCNLGLSGTSLPELATVLEFALRRQRPKRVILGTDFFMFSDTRKSTAGFESSRFDPDLRIFDYHLKNVLGAQALADSWRLLRQWMWRERPLAVERGFLPKSLRAGTSQRDTFARCIKKFVTEPETYGAYHYSNERLELVRRMIRQCRRAEVELIIFIPPVHALELETIRAAGLWDTLEGWKRDLTRLAAEENANEPSARPVPIWDFTGFAGPVIEEVPRAGDRQTRMRWYLENSHFTPALGEMLLDRMLADLGDGAEHPGLGARLTPGSLDEHLARLRREREAYATSHAHEIAWVSELTRDKARKVSGGEDL
jgi:hypothetical protein